MLTVPRPKPPAINDVSKSVRDIIVGQGIAKLLEISPGNNNKVAFSLPWIDVGAYIESESFRVREWQHEADLFLQS